MRKWAEGEALPTSSRMPQVAAVLGVRRAWLHEEPMRPLASGVAGQKRSHAINPEQKLMLSREETKLLLQYRNLFPRQKDAVQEIVALSIETSKRRRA